ncbi:unnamed protein product [Rotaria socialis]|uniref:Uncharacterized protein n=1 Tax=Rotaria socialis TaxID=392032 RepID=A0A820T088_9BILA|nr:unnamed protein product [Rotaria socialis]CAF4460886.1 unnamed protein product [Rotaria socialis]
MKDNHKFRNETYRERIKLKRSLSKKFDEECRRKKASYQAKWRRNKKEEQQQSTISIPSVSTSRTKDLRKKEGQRRRRLHISSLRADNIKLRETVRILTKEIKQLRSSRTPTPPPDSPSKFFFDNVSPNAKQRTVLRLKDKIENLPRGTSAQIRNDITKLCPDKHKQIDGNQIRYRLNHLNILHQQFELESTIDIDYVTFTRYIPSYIKKPNNDSWGTCLCMPCLNPQLKYEKLHQLKRKHACIKVIVDFTPIDLYDLAKDEIKINEFKDNFTKLDKEDEEILVTFCEWQKIKAPNCTAPVSTKVSISISMKEFIKKFIIEVDVSVYLFY